jgi:TolA-binding protein
MRWDMVQIWSNMLACVGRTRLGGIKMHNSRQLVFAITFFLSTVTAAVAADRELLELQNQVQVLQDQLSRLQRSVDENIGVISDALKRNSESVGKMQQNVQQIVARVGQQNSSVTAQIAVFSSQINKLQSSTGELNSRIEAAAQKLSAPVRVQSAPATDSSGPTGAPQQPPPAPLAAVSAGAAATESLRNRDSASVSVQQPAPVARENAAPPAASSAALYDMAMQHFASKDYETAANEFTKYLKADRESSKAITAQFYLAEIEYEQQDFEGALDDYTDVGPHLSNPAMAATAQYKKALCLLEVEREEEAVRELQTVLRLYPQSPEAARAAKKLRSLQAKQTSAR